MWSAFSVRRDGAVEVKKRVGEFKNSSVIIREKRGEHWRTRHQRKKEA